MRDDAGQTPRAADDDGEVEAFFRLAGRRPRLPEREVAPAREVVRAAWRGQVRRTTRVRLVGLAAALAAGALLVTGSLWLGLERPAARSVAALALESGEVTLSGPDGRPQALAPGTVIATGSGARAAVRLASGPSVRIDEGSLVRLESAEVVALDRGALYVDSGAAPGSAALEVATPLGTVRHLGTQFETRLLTGEDGSPPGRGDERGARRRRAHLVSGRGAPPRPGPPSRATLEMGRAVGPSPRHRKRLAGEVPGVGLARDRPPLAVLRAGYGRGGRGDHPPRVDRGAHARGGARRRPPRLWLPAPAGGRRAGAAPRPVTVSARYISQRTPNEGRSPPQVRVSDRTATAPSEPRSKSRSSKPRAFSRS